MKPLASGGITLGQLSALLRLMREFQVAEVSVGDVHVRLAPLAAPKPKPKEPQGPAPTLDELVDQDADFQAFMLGRLPNKAV